MSPLGARLRDDRGMTLVELLVSMVLISIVGVVITTGYMSTLRGIRYDDDEAQGLSDVRKVVERLGRDVRQARSIDAGADASQLALWIDYDSDYKKDTNEVVTWRLQAGAEAGHYDVVRSVPGGAEYRQATTLVSQIAFQYFDSAAGSPTTLPLTSGTAATVRLVKTEMTYNALLAGGSGDRNVTFATRLRNVS